MELPSKNLKLTPMTQISSNKSSKLDRNPKFFMYCCSRKENIVSSEIPQCLEKNVEELERDSTEHLKRSRSTIRPGKQLKIKKELSKYRNELRQFSNNTKELEKRYTRINSEFNEMKQKHHYIIAKRNLSCGDIDCFSDSSSIATEYSLQRKDTQVFDRNNNFIKMLSNDPLKEINYKLPDDTESSLSITNDHNRETAERNIKQQREHKENVIPSDGNSNYKNNSKNEYYALRPEVNNSNSKAQHNGDVYSLKKAVTKLQADSEHFCSIIEQQNTTLSDYRLRFVKARHLVKEQRSEIEQLNAKNEQIEKDASQIIDELHVKIEAKLKDVDLLSDRLRSEHIKRDHMIKENYLLNERIQAVEAEAKQLKVKLEEMSRRKMTTISRLKVAERDLKIFKNYNAALKEEKRHLIEEMRNMNEQIDNMQNIGKRAMNRNREQTEKQKRQLQKRIFELEMKLNRSQNSTASLIQERDSLISELQNQLNNLVHNFEVSQKHIRVLRRHIYSMCGNSNHQPVIG